jgi:hypothetical protein
MMTEIDLKGGFDIEFEVSDGELDFPGFSVDPTVPIHNQVRLVRCFS